MEPTKKPLNLLATQINSFIDVKLKSGLEYKGIMIYCDGFMNIILDGAVEYYKGQLLANYGRVLVRGNNIFYIVLRPSKR